MGEITFLVLRLDQERKPSEDQKKSTNWSKLADTTIIGEGNVIACAAE